MIVRDCFINLKEYVYMPYAIIVITILLLIIFAILFFRKNANSTVATQVKNVITNDTNGLITNKKTETKKLTIQERLELSWKFLYEITEKIINNFSNEDKEKVNIIGLSLLNNGMRYEHVVDLGIKLTPDKGKFADLEQEKLEEHDTGIAR